MAYRLGVDVGTTNTAAAVWDGERVDAVQLSNHSQVAPTVVFRKEDGDLLFGEAAERRASAAPERVAREFKRRVGDSVPLLVGGTPFAAADLMALMLRWVLDRVEELQGGPPQQLQVTLPANWGSFRRDVYGEALRDVGVDDVRFLTEPEAAAVHFAGSRRVEQGEVVAIYDLGGGTFDAAVLQRTAAGFEIVGRPEGIESLGGMDVDEAVQGHVWRALADRSDASSGGSLPPDVEAIDPARLAELRREVVSAKEQLSEDIDAVIPVDLGGGRHDVVMRRSELEELIQPMLELTVEAVERSLAHAEVRMDQLTAVVLVGGSSRIPLVQQLLSSRLGVPIVLDSQPQLAVAVGAAMTAGGWLERDVAERPAQVHAPAQVTEPVLEPVPKSVPSPASPVLSMTEVLRRRRGLVYAGAALAVALIMIGVASAANILGAGGTSAAQRSGSSAPTAVPTTPSPMGAPATAANILINVRLRGPTGSGDVTSEPVGIRCPPGGRACMHLVPPGTTVVLRPRALQRGAQFRVWTGACSGAGTCTVKAGRAGSPPIAIEARFAVPTYTASTRSQPTTGQGSIDRPIDGPGKPTTKRTTTKPTGKPTTKPMTSKPKPKPDKPDPTPEPKPPPVDPPPPEGTETPHPGPS